MSVLTHFEIYADKPEELTHFYRSLFGWQLDREPGLDYWRIQTGPKSSNGFNGGLTFRAFPGIRSWVFYINVDSLDETLTQAQQLGAKVLRPKTAVPKSAWYAVLADPQGNAFAVWQADPSAFPIPEPE